jgi:dTDP-4-amino-4,6-dideoxygalactose transaminase
MKMRPVPVLIPCMPSTDALVGYLKRIEERKQYSNFGPLNAEFIDRLSATSGIEVSGIATAANATLALQGLVSTSTEVPDKTWYSPAWTFTATASALLQARANLKFVDIDEEGNAVYPEDAQFLIEVWPFGLRSRTSPLAPGVQRVVVDAAAGFDSITDFFFIDQVPTAVVVSLHATKLLGAGEGAFIITNDVAWAQRFRSWTNFGMDEDRISKSLGTNAKLSEYSAAVALASLDSWTSTKSEYEIISKIAREISEKYDFIPFMSLSQNSITPYWILKFNTIAEKEVFTDIARELSIQLREWWAQGCHEMPAYENIPHDLLTNTRKVASTTIGLPFHTSLEGEDWNRIEELFYLWNHSIKFNK